MKKIILSTLFICIIIASLTMLYLPKVSIECGDNQLSISISNNNAQAATDLTANITYPPSIKTDQEKLYATYNLIEQMRGEYNSKVEIAKSNPAKYISSGILKTFSNLYDKKIVKLTAERNRLKDNIRWATYTPEEWAEFDPEEIVQVCESLYGSKESLRNIPTLATSGELEFIKSVNLDDLTPAILTDPLEDFTSVDWNNGVPQQNDNTRIAANITSTMVSYVSADRLSDYWHYRDFGSNHFDGDFEHKFEIYVSSESGSPIVGNWVMTNGIDGIYQLYANNIDSLWVYLYNGTDSIRIYEDNGGSLTYDSSSGTDITGTLYYMTLWRDEAVGANGHLYMYICTGGYHGGGGADIDLLDVTLTEKQDFQYLCSVTGYSQSTSGEGVTGYIRNLDIQEAGPGTLEITGLTLTDLGAITAQADYTLGGNTTYAAIIINRSHTPTSPTDGELYYYGTDVSVNITGLALDCTTYYVAIFPYASDNVTFGDPATEEVGGNLMIYLSLAFLAIGLTVAMFATKQSMLGFPCVIFWAVLGGYAYTQFSTAWVDWQFYLMFACLAGMVPFSALAAYGLREKRDTIGDVEMERGDGTFIDEKPAKKLQPEIEKARIVDEESAGYEPGSYARKRQLGKRKRNKSGDVYL